MSETRYMCTYSGCDFCDNDEENAERHSESYGNDHDLLRIEFDKNYKTVKAKFIDNSNLSVTQ